MSERYSESERIYHWQFALYDVYNLLKETMKPLTIEQIKNYVEPHTWVGIYGRKTEVIRRILEELVLKGYVEQVDQEHWKAKH